MPGFRRAVEIATAWWTAASALINGCLCRGVVSDLCGNSCGLSQYTGPVASSPSSEASTSAFRKRRIEKVAETLAREIVHDIVQRDLPVGSVLPNEAEMFETYGVGRTTVREALRLLEVNGLITIKTGPKGGPIVAQASSVEFAKTASLYFHVSRATFAELVEARIMVEPMMASLAARRHSSETERALRESLDLTRQAIEEGDDKLYIAQASNFHGIIAGLSGNRVLDFFGGALKHIYYERVWEALIDKPRRPEVLDAHTAVTDAIVAGDADLAHRLMTEHMDEVNTMLTEHLPRAASELIDWRSR